MYTVHNIARHAVAYTETRSLFTGVASVDVPAPFRLRDMEFISGFSAPPVQPRISTLSAEHQHGNMLVARTREGGMGEGQTEPKELHKADAGAPGCH